MVVHIDWDLRLLWLLFKFRSFSGLSASNAWVLLKGRGAHGLFDLRGLHPLASRLALDVHILHLIIQSLGHLHLSFPLEVLLGLVEGRWLLTSLSLTRLYSLKLLLLLILSELLLLLNLLLLLLHLDLRVVLSNNVFYVWIVRSLFQLVNFSFYDLCCFIVLICRCHILPLV